MFESILWPTITSDCTTQLAGCVGQLTPRTVSQAAAHCSHFPGCYRTESSFQWRLEASVVTRPVMASRIVKSPAVQSTARRQYGQAAVARTEREFVKSEPLKVSTLPNGLTVASIENHSPVTTLGVAIKVRLYSKTNLVLMLLFD